MPVVIGAILAAVFYPLYRQAEEHIRQEVHAAIELEILSLDDHLHEKGLAGLVEELGERVASPVDPDAVYCLADTQDRVLAGNLPAWPAGLTRQDEAWFRIKDAAGHNIEGKIFVLYGGERLLVGRRSPLAPFRESMTIRLAWSGALTILATALIVGAFMRYLHRRLQRMADEAKAIQRGHLSRRLSLNARRDELDLLAVRFNQAFDEIERLVDATRHVSSAVAHDMRRPLIHLRNTLEAELAELAPGTKLAQRLKALVGQTDALLATFSALLRLARLESGTWEVRRQPCDLAEIAEDAVDLYAAQAEQEARSITLAGGPLVVEGDRDLLFQLFQNLLENALRHGAGTVAVELARDGGNARIQVRDQGPGVPAAALPRIFERFYLADPSRSEVGSGVGLALVKGIVEAHGGRVTAENGAPGLRIAVWLPLETRYYPDPIAEPSEP
ncbi:MAG: HAMP domain-containing histidine kinase [Zoogloeaceae bacterium]|nr:HAMP domain-containing histidine kinase [Zoogloeaceae bacterium]